MLLPATDIARPQYSSQTHATCSCSFKVSTNVITGVAAVHPEALPPPPPPAPPKGKKAEPLPPPPPLDLTAFHWTGDRHVYLVELDMSSDAIKSRYRYTSASFACVWIQHKFTSYVNPQGCITMLSAYVRQKPLPALLNALWSSMTQMLYTWHVVHV